MREVVIDGNEINSRCQLHEKLSEGLKFPEWYGRNLDALHDLLTEAGEEVVITVKDFPALEENLGRYAHLLRKVISDAAEENQKIKIEII